MYQNCNSSIDPIRARLVDENLNKPQIIEQSFST